MKRISLYLVMEIIIVMALVWATFDFTRKMNWNYIFVMPIILAQMALIAGYWKIYAHNKTPAKSSLIIMVWFILGSIYCFLTWPPAPLEDFLLYTFPGLSALFVIYMAILKKKEKDNP